jgi:hypothetical protein
MTGCLCLASRTVVVSSAGSSAHPRRGGKRPAVLARDKVVRNSRRVCTSVIAGFLPYYAFSSRLSSFKKRPFDVFALARVAKSLALSQKLGVAMIDELKGMVRLELGLPRGIGDKW